MTESSDLSVTFLGTGTSHGVPVIGCDCPVCTSKDPRNDRYRSSVWLQRDGRSLLIDTATELRLQARRADIRRLDAVLFTHAHADHVSGLDDVRRFNELQGASLPCYGNAATVGELFARYSYAFEGGQAGGGRPRLDLRAIEAGQEFIAAGMAVTAIAANHGALPILGYRIGGFAYVTDVSSFSDESLAALEGLIVLVLGALRWKPHPTHLSIDEALAVVRRVRPARAIFTHLCHDVDHADTSSRLPAGVELAFDGLKVSVDG